MKKNGFFTFIFSFIPGAGQMYQEYMKRGLSIMIIAGIFLILASMAGSPIFLIPILIISAYSFFDTYRLRNMSDDKRKDFIDNYIWSLSDIGFDIKSKNIRKTIGYTLIVVGLYVLVDSVLLRIASQLQIPWLTDLCSILSRYVPTIAVSSISVFAGLKLVSIKQKEE